MQNCKSKFKKYLCKIKISSMLVLIIYVFLNKNNIA